MKKQTLDTPKGEIRTSFRHLQAELARIDARIHREVHRWQLAGQDPSDVFRGLYVSGAEAEGLLARPLSAGWGASVDLGDETEQAFAEAEANAAGQAQRLLEAALAAGEIPRLAYLKAAFDLDGFELDTLLLCLAPALDLRYQRLYAFLQDDVTRKRPTVNLMLDLLCAPDPAERLPYLLRFAAGAPLFRHHLLTRTSESGARPASLLGETLETDPSVVTWLLGEYQPHADLGVHARLSWPQMDEATALLAGGPDKVHEILACGSTGDDPPIVIFCGPDQASREAAARLLAANLRRGQLRVDLAAVIASGTPPAAALNLALRDARLTGAIPYLTGWDACLAAHQETGSGSGEGGADKSTPTTVISGSSPSPGVMAQLCAYPDLILVAGQTAWQAAGIERDRTLLRIDFPAPAFSQREALWTFFLSGTGGQNGHVDTSEDDAIAGADRAPANALGNTTSGIKAGEFDLVALAGQFSLTTQQIRDAVAGGRDRAAQRGGALTLQDLFAAARAGSNPRLSSLAHKITPRFTWSDIVLPADQVAMLHEIVAMVRRRSLVLEEWGVGQKLVSSPGVTMLFSGPPGTGKTMAAEVIASELALDLYKIDLSSIVSKYIGETEKNLERIFGEAQSSNAILFFDEADAIFGKRSEVKDAHDRYANIEVSYLLQRMEAYDGVTILATNLRANLDDAFTRRLQFAIDFPFPEEDYRLQIWQTLFPPGVPRDADLDFDFLARRFKLAGGNIRNILVSAAYLAANDGKRVTMRHLFHGTRRELQKMGRLVNEKDLLLDSKNPPRR